MLCLLLFSCGLLSWLHLNPHPDRISFPSSMGGPRSVPLLPLPFSFALNFDVNKTSPTTTTNQNIDRVLFDFCKFLLNHGWSRALPTVDGERKWPKSWIQRRIPNPSLYFSWNRT